MTSRPQAISTSAAVCPTTAGTSTERVTSPGVAAAGLAGGPDPLERGPRPSASPREWLYSSAQVAASRATRGPPALPPTMIGGWRLPSARRGRARSRRPPPPSGCPANDHPGGSDQSPWTICQRLLEHVHARPQVGEREAVAAVLDLVPPGPQARPPAARRSSRPRSRPPSPARPERGRSPARRAPRARSAPCRAPAPRGSPMRRWWAGRAAREARVVVGSEEGLEPRRSPPSGRARGSPGTTAPAEARPSARSAWHPPFEPTSCV